MKKILCSTLFLLSLTVAFAQKPSSDTSSQKRTERAEKLKSLNLTPEQRQKIKEINGANRAARMKIDADSSLSVEQKKTKIREMRKAQMEKLGKILTPEQLEQFRDLKKED